MNNKRSFFKRKLKIGLALGGGGARGFTHIGVIKAFEEQGIEFDFIAATSAGALVGAMYAAGFTAQEMIDKTADFDIKDIKTSKIPLMPHKTEALQNVIKQTIGDLQFSDLKKPFCSVAVDVRTGEEIHLIKGNLAPAVAASCAVPGVFLPVEIDDYLLMDGGLLNNIPSSVPKLFGCDIVISVDINSSRGAGTKSSKYLDIVLSSIQIMMKSNSLKGYVDADVMIAPDTKRFRSTKIVSKEEMIEEGYKAANEKINDIKRIVGMKILKDPNVKKLYEEHQKKKRIRNFFRKNSVSTTNLAEEDIIEISHEIEKQTEATKDKIKIKNKKKKKD